MHDEAGKKLKYTMASLWKWRVFFTFITLSGLFLFLYFSPIFSSFFYKIDNHFYKNFQTFLSASPYLQTILILANHQSSHALFYLFASLIWIFSAKNSPSHLVFYKFAEKIFSTLVIIFTVLVLNDLILHQFFHFNRVGPKFYNPLSNILLQISSWIHHKNSEIFVFPNLFSTTVVSYLFLTIIQLGLRKSALAIFLGLYFLIPQLFLGNYGITDIVLGSGSLSFATIAFSQYTPIYYYFVNNIEKILRKILKSYRA